MTSVIDQLKKANAERTQGEWGTTGNDAARYITGMGCDANFTALAANNMSALLAVVEAAGLGK